MKKFLGLCLTVVVLGVVTGCGSTKTLTCVQEENEDGLKMKQTIEAVFKKDSVTKMTMTNEMEVPEEYKSYLSVFESSLKEELSEYENKSGVTVDMKTKDSVLSAVITADLTKMDEETKEELEIAGNNKKYDEIKKSMEEEGYTCK